MFNLLKTYKDLSAGAAFIIAAVVAEYVFKAGNAWAAPALYVIAYLIIGGPVWAEAWKSIIRGRIFTEHFLMGIATAGAFALGDYLEGVSVMLFYMIGEYTQHGAVHKARRSIKELIDKQPDTASVERNGILMEVHPSEVNKNEIILVKPGGRVPLDGEIITEGASFNTAAITGESKPMMRTAGEQIWAGSINLEIPARIKVSGAFEDSKLANILKLVEDASKRKAVTERFMSKFARIYTPVVVWLAVALTFLPWLFVQDYVFQDWFYRALIFLVVSCPCGLVISIPLGYFGGIGAASQNGILLKGSDYLDQLRKMDTLFTDKTGTLTEGNFKIQQISTAGVIDEAELLKLAASLEQYSAHPAARAVMDGAGETVLYEVEKQQEIAGQGIKGVINGNEILAGNAKLLTAHGVALPESGFDQPYTFIHIAAAGKYAGTISIADTIKEESAAAVAALKKLGVSRIVMLSGDNQPVVDYVAAQLGIEEARGGLMPEEKYDFVQRELTAGRVIGFAGDGINDAPVITLADVGIAMGGIGADATVETADVVIQTDNPAKIPLSIKIARFTHRIVWQNIAFAMGTKLFVLALAAAGLANMWMAIFADVGVALIAIANAIRVQNRFSEEKVRLTAKSTHHEEEHKHLSEMECLACSTSAVEEAAQ